MMYGTKKITLLCLFTAAMISAWPKILRSEMNIIETTILFVTQDEIYINRGADSGLDTGDEGSVQRDGVEIARVRIVDFTRTSSRVAVQGKVSKSPALDDKVIFRKKSTPVPPPSDT